MKNRVTFRIVSYALALGAACLATSSFAAWEFIPEVSLSAETNDNLRLQPDNDPDVSNASRTRLDARFSLSNFSERGDLYVEPRARFESFSDTANQDLDGTDTFLRSRGRYSWERLTLGFRSDYDRQDVRDAEITQAAPDDPDVEDPIDPDTGRLVVIAQDRERLSISPYADIQISERSSLLLEMRVLDVSYTQSQLQGRVDFQDTQFAAGIVRRVDARNQVSARLLASSYEADLNQNYTDTFGVEGDFRRPLGRDWTFILSAGVSRSDYTFLNSQGMLVDNADTSLTYGLGFRQRTTRNTINIDARRATNPNSGGFLTLRDELRVYFRRALTERLSGRVALRGYHTQTLDDVVQDDDRDYFRLEFDMEWALTPRLFIIGGYSFTTQEFATQSAEDASSNTVFVGFNYRGLSAR